MTKKTYSVDDVTNGIAWIYPNGNGDSTDRGASNLVDYNKNPYRLRVKREAKSQNERYYD